MQSYRIRFVVDQDKKRDMAVWYLFFDKSL